MTTHHALRLYRRETTDSNHIWVPVLVLLLRNLRKWQDVPDHPGDRSVGSSPQSAPTRYPCSLYNLARL